MADGDTTTAISKEEYDKQKAKADTWMAKATDLEKKLKEFEGVDIPKLKAIAEDYDNIRREQANENPDKLKEWKKSEADKLRNEIAKELKDARELAEKLQKENKRLKVTDKVFASISSKFNEDVADDLKEYAERFGDLDEQGNIVFKDAQGNVRFKNGNEPFTVEDFGAELAQKKPSWAKATFTGGTHQNGATSKGGADYSHIRSLTDLNKLPNAREVFAKMSPEQQHAIGVNTKL